MPIRNASMFRWIFFATLAFAVAAACSISPVAFAEDDADDQPVLMDFNGPLQFTYGSFKNKMKSSGGKLVVKANKDAGGGGSNLKLDLSAWPGHSPRLTLDVGEDHKAPILRVAFIDEQRNNAEFVFTLKGLEAGEGHEVLPDHAASLAEPNKQKLKGDAEAVDWSAITQVQIQGGWKGEPVDLALDRLMLMPPTAEMQAQREAERERRAKAAERARKKAAELERKRQEMLANMTHPEGGPEVTHISAVAPDLLAVTIIAGEVIHRGQEDYVKQEGDKINRKGPKTYMWEHGEVVHDKRDLILLRANEDGKGHHPAGRLAINAGKVWPNEGYRGQAISELTVDSPEAYHIASESDARYAEPTAPVAVHRKSKAIDRTQNTGKSRSQMRHTVFLKLPHAMKDGASYQVRFTGVNTRQEQVTYRHEPRQTRSIAVHVNQVGYRPDDPYKRAFLSIWLGTGGAHAYDTDGLRFHLLDEATGESVFHGPVELAQAADEDGSIRGDYNHNQTHVYRLDFAAFTAPGRYRVFVEGIGISYPFDIAADVWQRAMKVSMMGLLHHRSGIELGPPFTEYVRPRNFHPADGAKVYQTDSPTGETAGITRHFRADLEDGRIDSPQVPEAWGGYMDAGDWDRRSQHMTVSYLHLELLELFPDYFRQLKLNLPPGEANNDVPDLLDEALWNIALYKRLQTAGGGVRSGVESTSHPRKGEASWQESLLIGVFSELDIATYDFAAVAAKLARLTAESHPDLAAEYRPAAIAAWNWATANEDPDLKGRHLKSRQASRTAAAVELYWLTGEAKYHDDFKRFAEAHPENLFKGDAVRHQDALFTYARMPDDLADPELQQRSRDAILRLAGIASKFAEGNAWGIAIDVPDLPVMGWLGLFTCPGSISRSVTRAHYLTGDEALLAVAIGQTNFSLGANPDNTVYTTGLGHEPVRHPLHVDSRVTGQPAPIGITVYGPSDPRAGFDFESWVHTWHLQDVVPNSRAWPAAEAYHDIYGWPSSCEYTIQRPIGPTGYHWAYLAARGR